MPSPSCCRWRPRLLGLAHDGTVYVLDIIRSTLDSPDVKRLVRQTAELDGREVVIGMEQESDASGKAVIQDYRRTLAGLRLPAAAAVRGECDARSALRLLRGGWRGAAGCGRPALYS